MTGERQQCVRIYGEVELGLSLGSILHGAFRTALSANRVLYGVLNRFIEAFHREANDIDDAAMKNNKTPENRNHLDQLRAVFTEILLEFEARERLLYASVALKQRGKVPLKLDLTDPSTITAFFHTDWKSVVTMDDLFKPTVRQQAEEGMSKISSRFSKLKQKATQKIRHERGEELSEDEKDLKDMDLNALEPETEEDKEAAAAIAKEHNEPKIRAVQKNVGQAIKDVYHEAIHELLEVCDQSILGFTALLELYRILALGGSGANIPSFDAGVEALAFKAGEIPDGELIAAMTSRPIIQLQQATEAIKRTTAMTYFHGEYTVRIAIPRAQRLGVGSLRLTHYPDGLKDLLSVAPPPPPSRVVAAPPTSEVQ